MSSNQSTYLNRPGGADACELCEFAGGNCAGGGDGTLRLFVNRGGRNKQRI